MIAITRHAPLVAYLAEIGLIPALDSEDPVCRVCGGLRIARDYGDPPGCDCRVIAHATADDVRGQDVIGVLPMHLAALARTVTEVPLALTPEDRVVMQAGDLPIERLREIAGAPVKYAVRIV